MGTTAEVRKYREVVRQQGKTSLEEARKLMTAWVGATDAAYQRLLAELRDIDARAQVAKLDTAYKRMRTEMKDLDTRARVAKLQGQVKTGYADLAKRGEKVIEDLRQRPQTRMVFDRAEQVLRRTEKRVEHAEKQVTGKPAKSARTTASKPTSSR